MLSKWKVHDRIKRTAIFTAAKEHLQNTNEASAFLDILMIPTLASAEEDWVLS